MVFGCAAMFLLSFECMNCVIGVGEGADKVLSFPMEAAISESFCPWNATSVCRRVFCESPDKHESFALIIHGVRMYMRMKTTREASEHFIEFRKRAWKHLGKNAAHMWNTDNVFNFPNLQPFQRADLCGEETGGHAASSFA